MPFFLIILGLPLCDLLWWWWASRRLRLLRHAGRWRAALAVFMALELGIYFILIASRLMGVRVFEFTSLLAVAYLWHLIVLPATMILLAVEVSANFLGRFARHRVVPTMAESETSTPVRGPTRRQVLAAGLVAVPPLITIGGAARGLSQLDEFRIRRMDLILPTLPPALEGLTIAQVSDIHLGRFTREATLRKIVEATNNLRADLVFMPGDLIDFQISDLPAALDAVKKMNSRFGLFMCEGNHDLFQDRDAFENGVKVSGVPLLINEDATVRVRGVDVKIVGLRWNQPRMPGRLYIDPYMVEKMRRAAGHEFSIFLAHHPHAFDQAAEVGIPLTLAGHSHGGQLMLTENIGFGPWMFKYWTGLYTRGNSSLVVSNGVGNWFPLRVNAPAEIVHLTLHRA